MNLIKKFLELKVEYWDYPGRYGKVVTRKDWVYIKKNNLEFYRKILSSDSIGYCYYYSRELALLLKDAKIMYCSIEVEDGEKTGHAVILKNDCVYSTNTREHYCLNVYKKMRGFEIFKIFSEEEYRKEDFFDNIREDFVKWCAERNVYCDPQ